MMCECVPSTLSLSLSFYTGLTESNWNRTSRRGNAHPPPHRYPVPTSSSSSLSYHSSKCFVVTPNSSMLGSRDYDFYGELGFKESKKDLFEPMEIRHQNDSKLAEDLEAEATEGLSPKVEESAKSNGGLGFRRGRQIIKRSSMIAKQVISIQSALCLGFVSQLWVDTNSWILVTVEVRPTLLLGEAERFLLEDVGQVGDVVLVQDECVLEKEFKTAGMETLYVCLHIQQENASFRDWGESSLLWGVLTVKVKVQVLLWFLVPYEVSVSVRCRVQCHNTKTTQYWEGAWIHLQYQLGLWRHLSSIHSDGPSFHQVCTYALFVKDVLEVVSDKVVVHENAASRVQRLTKGFLAAQNARIPLEEDTEISDMERQSLQDRNRCGKKRSSRKKFKSNARDSEENDWELPMDYL
ncbi:hypothetical protein RJ641_028660 [Dillenia turbinata]|uniref:Uncharacterized protein n=1 Tax=Dillenia turbinata TaxID=194707 RepID=A0AAN8VYQ8_9MAGN